MIYVLVIISSVFIGIAFLLTEKNAQHLLSGYNSMSEEEREKVDIKKLIPYFRNFHIFLGISFFLGSTLLLRYAGSTIGTIFICIYPVLAETYFVLSSRRFTKNI